MQKTEQFEAKRREILKKYREKQEFRVAIGKSGWVWYEFFNPEFNLREILADEVVIELDSLKEWKKMSPKEQENFRFFSFQAIHIIGIKLYLAGITFEVWYHQGKSPHIHVHELPCGDLEPTERRLWKKAFLETYVPPQYHRFLDFSLCGTHLVRLEYSPCFKNQFGTKILLHKFEPKEK